MLLKVLAHNSIKLRKTEKVSFAKLDQITLQNLIKTAAGLFPRYIRTFCESILLYYFEPCILETNMISKIG